MALSSTLGSGPNSTFRENGTTTKSSSISRLSTTRLPCLSTFVSASKRVSSDSLGKKAGFHRGGYFRFSLDVTDYINRGQSNELVVFVYDPTDSEGDVASVSPAAHVDETDDTSRKAN